MKVSAVVFLLSFVGSSVAAPAIVWKNGREDSAATVIHSSNPVHAAEIIADVVGSSESLAAIFLVNRGSDGSESLTELTSNGSLPGVASKYEEASDRALEAIKSEQYAHEQTRSDLTMALADAMDVLKPN